jgi:hypothetical protein
VTIFPIIDPAEGESTAEALPLCREAAWDFEQDVPIFRRGAPVVVTGKAAVQVWCFRALTTPRYRYPIYSQDHGSELEGLMGRAYTRAIKEAEAPRYVRECLLQSPYVSAVPSVSAEFSEGKLTVSATVETIYGEVTTSADL